MSEVAATTSAVPTANTISRPKSKKELRVEKKAAKKAAAAPKPKPPTPEELKEQMREEKLRLKKERRKEQLKEREKEIRLEKKARKETRKRKEQLQNFLQSGWEKPRGKKRQKMDRAASEEQDVAVFDKVFNGAGEQEESGFSTLEMGVKCIDVVIGKGPEIVQNKSLVTVRYKLTGGKFGALIDSSKKFTFRVGKGEVIRGWDIGIQGMAVGGTRKLIVPPKAGYGGQDIGAGPGGLLFFDISVLSCA